MGAPQHRYTGEPVPSDRLGVTDDDLTGTLRTGPAPGDTGALADPTRNSGASLDYVRPLLGYGLTLAPQESDMGAEVKQAGAGRPFASPALRFPVQSDTPEPDRRRIARPMPTAAYDESQVIRPTSSEGGRG